MANINIEELTLKQIREIVQLAKALPSGADAYTGRTEGPERTPPFAVGTLVYARTVAYHCCGRIKEVRGQWLVLEDASYVGSDGRYSTATAEGFDAVDKAEVERVGNGGVLVVNMDAIGDVAILPSLPKHTK